MLLVLSDKGKGMQSSSEQPLVGEEHCVTTLITAAKESIKDRDLRLWKSIMSASSHPLKVFLPPLKNRALRDRSHPYQMPRVNTERFNILTKNGMNRSSVGENLPIHHFITYYVWISV